MPCHSVQWWFSKALADMSHTLLHAASPTIGASFMDAPAHAVTFTLPALA